MNGHTNGAISSPSTDLDVIVIGGGISGINAAYRISTELPTSSFAVLESRHEIGGTWSQFSYPGVRSDSDLYTFGFGFYPWKSSNSIASGESIMKYLRETIQHFNLEKHFRFRQRVKSADWREEEQKWRIEVDVSTESGETTRVVYWAKWMIMGSGYYSYEKPLKAPIPGIEKFQGKIVHPQFWPKDLDYKDKKMVIIGSGATAITLLPALIDGGVKHITQLQRSPTYVMSVPQHKPEDDGWFRKTMPQWVVLKWLRFTNILVANFLYYFCRAFPDRATKMIQAQAKKTLPANFPIDPDFKPNYKPWDQRLCFCPDGDYFKAFKTGRADVVTDTIKTVSQNGIQLNSGKKLDADIIVTATGLQMQLFGGMTLSVNGKPVDVPSQHLWRMAMITGVPNFGNIIGYWNLSWTLGSDTSIQLYIRLLKRLQENGYTSVAPEMSVEDQKKPDISPSPLNSTYVKSSIACMPRCKGSGPWQPRPNYFLDRWRADNCDLNEGMKWKKVST